MQDAGSFPSFLVRTLLRYRVPLSVKKEGKEGKHNSFPSKLIAGNSYHSGVSECQRNKKQHGELQGTLFMCASLSPNLQGHTEKLAGRLLSVGFASRLPERICSARQSPAGGGNTPLVWIWAPNSSQTAAAPPWVDCRVPGCVLESVPCVKCSLQAQTPVTGTLLHMAMPCAQGRGCVYPQAAKNQVTTDVAGNQKNKSTENKFLNFNLLIRFTFRFTLWTRKIVRLGQGTTRGRLLSLC